MKILVVVVTYNGLRWLDKCLGSVAAGRFDAADAGGQVVDLFVVDNASADGSADYVAEHFPSAILVRNSSNTGFAAANNLGMQYALDHDYDYVYLLNQDAWLFPETLDLLARASQTHPAYGILSPMQMQGNGLSMDSQFAKLFAGAVPDTDATPADNNTGHPAAGIVLLAARVMAAHWLIRCDALRQTGLFSEEFPIYGQDDDLCNRMRAAGWLTGIVPEAIAIHDRAQRTEDKSKLIFRNYYTGSLVRLRNPLLPRWKAWGYIIPLTFVKAVKYRSMEPFKYFIKLVKAR